MHKSPTQRIAIGVHIPRICATAGLVIFLAVSLGCPAGFAAGSKRVMLLHSFGLDFKPWSEYAKSIRTELLVMNAIEAMSSSKSDHRVLELKTSVNEGHEVLVTVADSGPGVDAENSEKIFDAFFTTKPDGMGMGLSICRSIIEIASGIADSDPKYTPWNGIPGRSTDCSLGWSEGTLEGEGPREDQKHNCRRAEQH